MKLIKTLLLPVLFVAMWSLTGCNEEPTTSVTSDNTTSLSKLEIPAGAVIESATFNIRVGDPYNHNITVHKVNVPWAESVTWDDFYASATPFDSVNSLGGFSAATTGLKTVGTVDFKALVQAWVDGTTDNNGVLLNQNVAGGYLNNYYSKEFGDGSLAAFLDITYSYGGELVSVTDFAFADTYISTQEPGTSHGDEIVMLNGRPFVNYIKHVLIQFDIDQPEPCFQDETAWAANEGPLTNRYVTKGNWATYIVYPNDDNVYNIYAGQNIFVGTATLTPDNGNVIINISLETGWVLNPDAEGDNAVKIQGYTSTPSGNPAPGLFTTYKGNDLTGISVPNNYAFYGIHLDVRGECPEE